MAKSVKMKMAIENINNGENVSENNIWKLFVKTDKKPVMAGES